MTAASTAAAPARPGPPVAERLSAARLGLARGGIEIWQTLTYWPDLVQVLFFSAVSVVALVVMRGHSVPGTTFSLGSLTLPGVIGMNIAVGGVTGVTALLAIDREDGTLLRAKATPGGMSAYVIGKIVLTAATVVLGLALMLIVGLFAFPGLHVTAIGWLTLVWVAALGLLATIPLGILLGSLIADPRFVGADRAAVRRRWRRSPASSTRSPTCRAGCRRSGRCSRCTGSGSACGRRCCRARSSRSSSTGPGGWGTCCSRCAAGRPWGCWRRRRCCGGWRSGSRGPRSWPGASARCCAGREGRAGRERFAVMSETVYNRIAMLRAERGVSRRELADALGVHYQTVGYLERGEYSPSLYLALRIAEYFEVPVEVVFATAPSPGSARRRRPPRPTATGRWVNRWALRHHSPDACVTNRDETDG